MISTNCGAGVRTPTSCSQRSQFLQPPAPRVLVRSSSCAVGLCIYCCSVQGAPAWGWDAQTWVMLSMQAGGIPACLIQLSPLTLTGTTTLCVQFPGHCRNSDRHRMSPRKNIQQGGTSCLCTLAEDSHTRDFTHCPPELTACVSFLLPPCLWFYQYCRVISCWFFQMRHGHRKRSTGFDMWAKNSSWILRFGWMTLRISVFKSGALLGQPGWIPAADGTLSHSFWGDCKLRWYQAVFMESCYVSELAGTRSL